METLPEVLHFDIFLYLSITELFSSISLINKPFKGLVGSYQFLERWLKEYFRLRDKLRISKTAVGGLLNAMVKRTGNNRFVEFTPVSTDGGADEDREQFWFGQVFEMNERPWCTLENIRNAHASAVLADTQTSTEGYFWASRQAVTIVRRWLAARGERLSKKNEHIATAIFNHVVTTFPLDALVIDEPDSEQLKDTIRKIFLNLRPFANGIKQTRRFPDNAKIHDMKFDMEGAASSSQLAFIRYIDVSRKGDFTCPVKTLMVFVSMDYFDVVDGCFKVYNSITTYEDLRNLSECGEGFASVGHLKERSGVEYCEFGKSRNGLQPVLWLNFLDEPRLTEISMELDKFVCGKYFYVKMIQPEDRRVERDWLHDDMNIDISYVVPRGTVINITEGE